MDMARWVADPLTGALSAALLHSLWQLAAVGLGAALVLRMTPEDRPSVRYALGCLGLLVMLLLPVFTAISHLQESPGRGSAVSHSPSLVGGTVSSPALEEVSAGPRGEGRGNADLRGDSLFGVHIPDSWQTVIDQRRPWLAVLWALGVLVFSLRHLGAWLLVRRRLGGAAEPATAEWQDRTQRLARRLQVTRPYRLLVGKGGGSPILLGWIRPTIVVPASLLLQLPSGQVEALVAHELAHLRRYDDWVNLAQLVVESLLFYHPAVWWLSGRVREEREASCDELAARGVGSRRRYGEALARLAGGSGPWKPALGAADSEIVRRLRRLVGTTDGAGATSGLVVVASVVLLLGGGALALGASQPEGRGAAAADGKAAVREWVGSPHDLLSRWQESLEAIAETPPPRPMWVGWGIRASAGKSSMVFSNAGAPGPAPDTGPTLQSVLERKREDREAAVGFLLRVRPPSANGGRPVVDGIRLRGATLPPGVGERDLRWLGTFSSEQSVGLLEHLHREGLPPTIDADLGAALTLHPEPSVAVSAVSRFLDEERSAPARAEAISWLDRQPADHTMELFSRIAEADTSATVLSAVAAAVDEYQTPAADLLLRRLAVTGPTARVREEAMQALEESPRPDLPSFLEGRVFRDGSPMVREAALHVLADLSPEQARPLLERIAREHFDRDVRAAAREAVEELGDR